MDSSKKALHCYKYWVQVYSLKILSDDTDLNYSED